MHEKVKHKFMHTSVLIGHGNRLEVGIDTLTTLLNRIELQTYNGLSPSVQVILFILQCG
jgi:hypothetical protein